MQTSQAKKRLSFLKDCRNTYGKNEKLSLTAIRWRKQWVNSTYRRNNMKNGSIDLRDKILLPKRAIIEMDSILAGNPD